MLCDDIAIVGYSHRLPGGIRSDDDFWRLLSEREIVQESIVDRYGRGTDLSAGFLAQVGSPAPMRGCSARERNCFLIAGFLECLREKQRTWTHR